MRILVTGCAGFIGSAVCRLLLEQGHGVEGVDNLNDTYDVRLKRWRLERLESHAGFRFSRVDICSYDDLHRLFARSSVDGSPFAAVINLGARAGIRESLEDPWSYYQANTFATLNLLDLCRSFGVTKFVLASTSSVYGEGRRPSQEDSDTSNPLSPYAASKKAAEDLVYTYHRLYGTDATTLRYFTVYGPAGRPDMSMFSFIRAIAEGEPITVFGDGRQERDFTYVDDVARGTVAALKPLGHQVINLGGDRPQVLADVIGMIEECVEQRARIEYAPAHAADVRASWADISRARELLGWTPQVHIEEGLMRTVEWYMENREWAKEIR